MKQDLPGRRIVDLVDPHEIRRVERSIAGKSLVAHAGGIEPNDLASQRADDRTIREHTHRRREERERRRAEKDLAPAAKAGVDRAVAVEPSDAKALLIERVECDSTNRSADQD